MSDVQIWNCDCVQGMADFLPDNSVECCITSIPFAALFSYSHKTEDIGNCQDSDNLMSCQFSVHIRYAFEQLFRVLKPGSIFCCHVQQLLTYKVQHGFMGMRDFRGAVISMAQNHGFFPHGEVAIVKNPRNIAKRNNLHSLMFVTGARDARALSPAMNDYVLFFRKPASDADPAGRVHGIIETQKEIMLVEPSPIIDYIDHGNIKRVKKEYRDIPYKIVSFDERLGTTVTRTVTGGEGINRDGWFTKEDWIKWAHGCWTDILEIDTLDGYKCARENEEEKHVCPLQLEVIRRCIKLYTNPGDTVLDPFMGIGSVAYVAVEQGRNAIGFELKESYHRMALANIEKAQNGTGQQISLFSEAI